MLVHVRAQQKLMVAFGAALTDRLVVDLKNHHGQCEMNYHLCLGLIPGCREDVARWSFTLAGDTLQHPSKTHNTAPTHNATSTCNAKSLSVVINRIDSAPYTTTIEIVQQGQVEYYIATPKLTVRLYHDAEMAEVVAWDNHRHWQPVYSYPNRKMYHRDEKLVLNRFLGEWLVHCRKLGLSPTGFVSPLP